jgi:anaerobic magnesium-protoporphyrin IX monomethyl ester cyclase
VRIQLVYAPPLIHHSRFAELNEGQLPPLGLLYIASYLRNKIPGIELKVTDGSITTYSKALEEVQSYKPDVIFMSYFTPLAPSAYAFINDVKSLFPKTLVVSGGPHVTVLPEEGFERSKSDVMVTGEGEITACEIIKMFGETKNIGEMAWAEIDGVAFRRNGVIERTPTRQFIQDLDSIPLPARDLVDLKKYQGWYVYKRRPGTIMFSARGCPYQCTFCSNQVWKTSKPYLRLRSPENVVDEIDEMMKKYGIREFYDWADEFNNSAKNAIGICEEIKRRGIDVTWHTQVRAHPMSDELAQAMADAGCWLAYVGIESGNPETVEGIQKHITLDQAIHCCETLKRHGMKVSGLFMLFNVWEQNGELRYEDTKMTEQTLKFARYLIDKKLIDYLGCTATTPYPGSKLYEIARRHRLIKEEMVTDWAAWLQKDLHIMNLPGVSHKDQIRMKSQGAWLQARCLLKSGNIGLKDAGFFARKSMRVVYDEFKSRLRKHRYRKEFIS